MSQAASQATVFYRDVAEKKIVWTIKDEGGFPAPMTQSGERSMPFWSSLSRVEKIIKTVEAYAGFQPYEISWDDFCKKWVPDLKKDGMLVGVNWSGKNAVGYDIKPKEVVESVKSYMKEFKKSNLFHFCGFLNKYDIIEDVKINNRTI